MKKVLNLIQMNNLLAFILWYIFLFSLLSFLLFIDSLKCLFFTTWSPFIKSDTPIRIQLKFNLRNRTIFFHYLGWLQLQINSLNLLFFNIIELHHFLFLIILKNQALILDKFLFLNRLFKRCHCNPTQTATLTGWWRLLLLALIWTVAINTNRTILHIMVALYTLCIIFLIWRVLHSALLCLLLKYLLKVGLCFIATCSKAAIPPQVHSFILFD